MIKVKLKRDKLLLRQVEGLLKKTAKVENFTKPAKIVTDEIKKSLRTGLVENLSSNIKLDTKRFNHLYTKQLLATVGTEVQKTTSFGLDVKHKIYIGYITEMSRAVLLEQGNERQNISLEAVLDWMDSKPNFQSLAVHEKYAIATSIQARLTTSGPYAYPIVETMWGEYQDEYVDAVVDKLKSIWE